MSGFAKIIKVKSPKKVLSGLRTGFKVGKPAVK